MENALLVGLSRQITLQRNLEVIANNVANMNTTGFKARTVNFEEFINEGDKVKIDTSNSSYVERVKE